MWIKKSIDPEKFGANSEKTVVKIKENWKIKTDDGVNKG